MFELTLAQIGLVFLIVMIGSTIQGALGYGLAMVASPVLILVEPYFIPGAMTISATLLVTLVIIRDRDELDLWGLRWAIAGAIPGMLLGTYFLTHMEIGRFKILFALIILLGVGLSLIKVKIEPTPKVLLVAGFISGLMGILTNMSGPAIALVFQRASGPKLRATISGYFVMSIVLSFANLIPAGRMGLRELALSLYLIPPVVVGFLLATYLKKYLDKGYTRPAVLGLTAASAVVVLVSALA